MLNKNISLFHIPHSSIHIPDTTCYVIDTTNEIIKLTDWATDLIFEINGIKSVRTPFNRIFCDVERFNSDKEHMNYYGRGVIYTKTEDGKDLRTNYNKDFIINLYNKHHNKLTKNVEKKLKKYDEALIIDCHSFPNKPITGEVGNSDIRPDICIGYDELNYNKKYTNIIINHFKNNGYSVSVNEPFSGSIVPLKYIGNNKVSSVMIEINKKLYMDDNSINTKNVINLNRLINDLFK